MDAEFARRFPGMWEHWSVRSNDDSAAILRLCDEAIENGFVTVGALNYFTELLVERLAGTGVRVGAVAGYPLGYASTPLKAAEAVASVRAGADEVDTCMAFNAFFDGKRDEVLDDLRAVVEAVKSQRENAVVKVIIETSHLNPAQISEASELVARSGADFVKASTGYADYGARVEDVAVIKAAVGDAVKVKASGGIRTLEFAEQLVRAGADRLAGTSGVDLAAAARLAAAG